MNIASIDVLAAAQQLAAQGRPCALATVLRVQAPASARPGDKAVVTEEGIVAGWIGGGCAQPAVLRTVRQALADGRARLIRIAPDEGGGVRELRDVLEFGMACHSGGTLELFVEPLMPATRLVVIGDSPVAQALAGLAPMLGFAVSVVAHGAPAGRFAGAAPVLDSDDPVQAARCLAPGAYVVVATQGRRDVQGLRAALALQARQVSFVASARKAQVLRASLVEAGADADAVRRIVAPAGHDIGAQTPEEIALSVLAALVSARRRGEGGAAGDATATIAAAAGRVPGPATAGPVPSVDAGVSTDVGRGTVGSGDAAPGRAVPAFGAACCGGPGGAARDRAAPARPAEPASVAPAAGCCGG